MEIAWSLHKGHVPLEEKGRIARARGGLIAGGNEERDCGTGGYLSRVLMLGVPDNVMCILHRSLPGTVRSCRLWGTIFELAMIISRSGTGPVSFFQQPPCPIHISQKKCWTTSSKIYMIQKTCFKAVISFLNRGSHAPENTFSPMSRLAPQRDYDNGNYLSGTFHLSCGLHQVSVHQIPSNHYTR